MNTTNYSLLDTRKSLDANKYEEKSNLPPEMSGSKLEDVLNNWIKYISDPKYPEQSKKKKDTRIRIRNGNGDSGYLLDDGTVKMNDKVFRLIIRKPDGTYLSYQDAIMQAYSQGKRLHFINRRKG